MYHASSNAIYIEVILIHKRHAPEQKNSPPQTAERLVRWRNMSFQNSLHQRKDADFLSD